MNVIKDEIGNRYGQLSVRRFAQMKHRQAQWLCRCDCGVYALVPGGDLRNRNSTSCGNHRLVISTQKIRRQPSAGHTKGNWRSPEYRTWRAMLTRCLNSNHAHYRDYGGRGISVHEGWRLSFPEFLNNMGLKPSPQHSIDRINVNGNYEPSNCRWASSKEQRLNQRPLERKAM